VNNKRKKYSMRGNNLPFLRGLLFKKKRRTDNSRSRDFAFFALKKRRVFPKKPEQFPDRKNIKTTKVLVKNEYQTFPLI
jgi:hypothetical protein